MLNEISFRPLTDEDKAELAEEYLRLSPKSRRARFIMPPTHLSKDWLVKLVDNVDGVNHIALVASVSDGDTEVNIAIGRLIRFPQNREIADVAVTVKDDFQGRGVGPLLVKNLLKEAAKDAPIKMIETEIQVGNRASEKMLCAVGEINARESSMGSTSISVRVNDSTYLMM